MKAEELLGRAREAVDINQVFGVPVERDGVTIIPVARVTGGGGGGYGPTEATGSGMGYGYRAEPVGVYVIRDGRVSFQPSVNVNKIVAQAMIVGGLAVLSAPRILKRVNKIVRA